MSKYPVLRKPFSNFPFTFSDQFLGSFDETIDQILNDVFGDQRRFKDVFKNKSDYPKTDVYVNEEDGLAVFKMAVPGLEKDDIKISIEEIISPAERKNIHILIISSEKSDVKEEESKSFVRKELKHSAFSRSWEIPDLDKDRIEKLSSSLKSGILEVSVPIITPKEIEEKKEAKRIEVKID